MLQLPLNELTSSDIKGLIDDAVSENKTIEYKSELPGKKDSDKKEFLADVSAFANTVGGDLIYGIEESEGIPKAIKGIKSNNLDEIILRLENMVRSGIEPRMNLNTIPVGTNNNETVLVLRISKSWQGPHRVIYKGHDKFYGRSSAGKYPLDTEELRNAFNESQDLIQKTKNFQLERVIRLRANDTPIPLREGPKISLHIIPLSTFNKKYFLNPKKIKETFEKVAPIVSMGWNSRINLDGYVNYSGNSEGNYAYNQIYRNGTIEAVDTLILSSSEDEKIIYSKDFEKNILKAFSAFIDKYKKLDITGTIVIFLTLIGVKGYKLNTGRNLMFEEPYRLKEDILALPEEIITDLGSENRKNT